VVYSALMFFINLLTLYSVLLRIANKRLRN